MNAGFPVVRPRRLRRTAAMRNLVAETALRPADLVLPMFVKEGIAEPQPIGSMPGVVQHTRDSLRKAAAEAVGAGVGGLILFGIPAVKDGRGSAADDPAGIVQLAIADVAAEVGDATVLMADLCLDEYTDHGHCGAADGGWRGGQRRHTGALRGDRGGAGVGRRARGRAQRNDGRPGRRDPVGPGRSGFRGRRHLRLLRRSTPPAFYGPFRDAAECAPQFGDRASYQQDPPGSAEALREVLLDIDEGADMVDGEARPGLPGRHRPQSPPPCTYPSPPTR